MRNPPVREMLAKSACVFFFFPPSTYGGDGACGPQESAPAGASAGSEQVG